MNKPINNYVHTKDVHNTQAAEHFLPILFEHIQPKSVADVGCGLGTWLKVLQNMGVNEVLGIDGNYIDQSNLQIDAEDFLLHDLTKPLIYSRKFDLAICLEVAEHLPEEASKIIVNTLTNLSETILFSAALPRQGGQNHINEQPFSYWVERFNKRGYLVKDVFRNEIWQNENIDWWYRQNMFLVVKDYGMQLPISDFYHPNRYHQIVLEMEKANQNLQNINNGKISFLKAVKILVKSFIQFGK